MARGSRAAGALLVAALILLALFALPRRFGYVPGDTGAYVEEIVYDGIFFLAAAACLLRARFAGPERGAWRLIGLGLVLNALGYLYTSATWMLTGDVPGFPSVSDVCWVAQYPLLYLGVVRLTHVRGRAVSGLASDSALAALGMATLAAAFVVPALYETTGGDPAAIITNLVYPLADIHLLGFVALAFALGGRRLGAVWWIFVGLGLLNLATDTVYLLAVAEETYVWGSLLDSGWPAVAILWALAPFLPVPAGGRAGGNQLWLRLTFPALASLIGTGVMLSSAIGGHHGVEIGLAALTLVAGVARAVQVAAEAQSLERAVSLREAELAQAQALTKAGSFTVDTRTGEVRWSEQMWRLQGREPGAFEPTVAATADLVHPEDAPRVEAEMLAARRGAGQFETSLRIVRADGEVRDAQIRGDVRDGMLRASLQDVTDQRRAEESRRQSEVRYRHLVENAHDGIWLLDRERRTLFVNQRMSAMLGRPAEEVVGVSPLAFTDAAGARELEAAWAAVEADQHRGVQFEARFEGSGGGAVWALASMSPLDDWSTGGTMLMVSDITHRKQLEERLRRGAEEDGLTGLANRAVFERAVDACAGAETSVAVVLLDLDHFKHVNDSAGHAAGDELIRHVARVLAGGVRKGDLVARFGGDEFAVLLRDADVDGALACVEHLLQRLREDRWRQINRQSASAGVVVAPAGTPASSGNLLKAADIALYEAKETGRDRCVLYRGPNGGLAWVDEVRSAIDEDRLVLHSQPLVCLAPGGGPPREELLVRMVDRNGEVLPPAAFIPTAEQFGLINDLDRWVVRQALELARGGRAVEVNVSGASLGEPAIPALVRDAVADGVDPSLLTFEITETATVRNLDGARAFTQALTELGCGVALDDFGTGYGSLTYLRHIPITELKIDRAFVRRVHEEPDDERMVRTVVGIAETLGLATVAEGVEDPAALEVLRAMGVGYAQGYAIGHPAPVDAPSVLRRA